MGGGGDDDENSRDRWKKGYRKDTANQQEKKQFEYAWKQILRVLDRTLSRTDRRRLHDAITKKHYSLEEIIEIGLDLFGHDE
jgi:hypothetical protein